MNQDQGGPGDRGAASRRQARIIQRRARIKVASTALRLLLTAGLLYWVWTGSRIGLIVTLALFAVAIELVSLTAPIVPPDKRR